MHGCSEADTSSSTVKELVKEPERLRKKSKTTRLQYEPPVEVPDSLSSEPTMEESMTVARKEIRYRPRKEMRNRPPRGFVYEENDPPRQQPKEVPHEQPGESETMEEQDRLSPKLATFVKGNGRLDHKRITQLVQAECIFARCSGTVSRLQELATHILASHNLAHWPNAPVLVNRKGKSLCTAELTDRAVCPFAASNSMCTNLD